MATVQALLKRDGDRYVLRGADRRGTVPRARVIARVSAGKLGPRPFTS